MRSRPGKLFPGQIKGRKGQDLGQTAQCDCELREPGEVPLSLALLCVNAFLSLSEALLPCYQAAIFFLPASQLQLTRPHYGWSNSCIPSNSFFQGDFLTQHQPNSKVRPVFWHMQELSFGICQLRFCSIFRLWYMPSAEQHLSGEYYPGCRQQQASGHMYKCIC